MTSLLRTAVTHTLLGVASLTAADFYVDGIAGSDVASGGSSAQPWKSVGYALTQVPAPTSGRHRVWILGNQSYVLSSPITLRRAIDLVGYGAKRPTFVAPSMGTAFRVDPLAITDTSLQSLVISKGTSGLEVAPTMGLVPSLTLAVEDCSFEGQSAASIGINLFSDTSDIRLSNCDFANAGGHGVKVSAITFPTRLVVSGCSFSNAPFTFYSPSGTNGPSQPIYDIAIEHSMFRRCSPAGIVLDARPAVPGQEDLRLAVRNCAFRHNTIGIRGSLAIDARVEVDRSTFIDHDVALQWSGTTAFFPGARQLFEFTHNVIRDCRGAGVSVAKVGSLAALGVFTRANLIESCDVGIDVQIGVAATGAVASQEDIVRGTTRAAISFVGQSATCPVSISNDILAQSAGVGLRATGRSPAHVQFSTIADCQGYALDLGSQAITLEHCALDNPFQPEVNGGAGLSVRYTCSRTTPFAGFGNLLANPQFVRPFYRLGRGSPCIDAGDPNQTATADYEGDPRVYGPRADLGADEFVLGSGHTFGAPMPRARNGFQPRMDPYVSGVGIGKPTNVVMYGAIDDANRRSPGAVLMLGLSDGAPVFDIDAAMPGGQLYFSPIAITNLVAVDPAGICIAKLSIPMQNALVGSTFTAQWLCVTPGSSPLGAMVSDGLRFTIGR
ncbi:MAG: right-handed parallel beta-helix repeat-containing protein [Planctomycetes bacterium]|nr:right-handed parallel beta-helix repeat-containing protein [Planctomycetota bacterium]